MRREDWQRLFHDAGVRSEIADMCARIVVNRFVRLRTEQISAARAKGLPLATVGAVFGLSAEGVRLASSRASGDLRAAGAKLEASGVCPCCGVQNK